MSCRHHSQSYVTCSGLGGHTAGVWGASLHHLLGLSLFGSPVSCISLLLSCFIPLSWRSTSSGGVAPVNRCMEETFFWNVECLIATFFLNYLAIMNSKLENTVGQKAMPSLSSSFRCCHFHSCFFIWYLFLSLEACRSFSPCLKLHISRLGLDLVLSTGLGT